MREIKFRGHDGSEWRYGQTFLYDEKDDTYFMMLGDYIDDWTKVLYLSQYTGLKDKNDKEIYDGDILDGSYINPMTNNRIERLYLVENYNGNTYSKLIGKSPYGDTFLYFKNEESEVIGNSYENPELLIK